METKGEICKQSFETKNGLDIHCFNFNVKEITKIDEEYNSKSIDWPFVYLLKNEENKEIYIGETTNIHSRVRSHLRFKGDYEKIYVIKDGSFNKSAILLIENYLIKYLSAENKYKLGNLKGGITHDFYNKEAYVSKFKDKIWPELISKRIATDSLSKIENSDLFKYSPYTAISKEQYEVTLEILQNLAEQQDKNSFVVGGLAGTGKTILGIYLTKVLTLQRRHSEFEIDEIAEALKDLSSKEIKDVALVIPQQSLRATLQYVFKRTPGLKANMVISPIDVSRKKYDLLIVDEAHRLKKRKNLHNWKAFDEANRRLGFGKNGHELDWIIKQSKYQIFFYDKFQSIRPSDITDSEFRDKTGHPSGERFPIRVPVPG